MTFKKLHSNCTFVTPIQSLEAKTFFLSLEADTIKKMNYKRGIRKGLETNWFKAADAKYEREIEQKIGIPEKITVQEQLDHYR